MERLEALSAEALVERFIEGATRILGATAFPVESRALELVEAPHSVRFDRLEPAEQALVSAALCEGGLHASGDALFVAQAVALSPAERKLAIVARSAAPIPRGALAALELLGSNLSLAARNGALRADLRERDARIVELDRLRSDLIAMLAHDFRGSLTTIVGYAELLKEGLIEGDGVSAAAQTIEGAAWRLTRLASDTLTMSQLERGEIVLCAAPVDLVELLVETIHGFGAPERIAFYTAERTLVAECDGRRIHQALENLIGNALKYSAPGEGITVTLAREGAQARIAVADRGIGIPSADLERVFERFARAGNAKRAGIKGSGFGLYLSRLLVALHGGSIEVASEEGRGSTFTLSLPLRAAAAVPELAVTDRR